MTAARLAGGLLLTFADRAGSARAPAIGGQIPDTDLATSAHFQGSPTWACRSPQPMKMGSTLAAAAGEA